MLSVEALTVSRYGEAAEVLARAFENDPAFCYILKGVTDRRRRIRWLFYRWIGVVGALGASYMTHGGEGVAIWVPPGYEHYVSIRRLLLAGIWKIPFVFGFRRIPRLLRVELDVQERRRRELDFPQWQLDTIAVDPGAQRSGVGSALIRHMFEVVGQGPYPCHVITHNPANVPYYERFGFRVLSQSSVEEKGFFVCSLRREAECRDNRVKATT